MGAMSELRNVVISVVSEVAVDGEGHVTITAENPAADGITEVALARAFNTPGAVGLHTIDVHTGEQWYTPLEGPA